MTVQIKIFYPHLLQYTDQKETIMVNGSTVGKCLDQLVKQFPDIKKEIFDENGQLLKYVYLIINGTFNYTTDLARSVHDGDELTIALLLAGG
jgi:adenylyltransferase/sulfurtransferase